MLIHMILKFSNTKYYLPIALEHYVKKNQKTDNKYITGQSNGQTICSDPMTDFLVMRDYLPMRDCLARP